MEDALHYFVISTDAGFYAQSGFVSDIEEALAFCSQIEAEQAATIIKGTVCPQSVLYEELEQSFIQLTAQFDVLYTLDEQQAIRTVCDELQTI
ncbi:MAG: hypothetical protein KBT36_12545 [Kurthia sp.]|nr:hypothetical protein [Candidatus Kurthia equi]